MKQSRGIRGELQIWQERFPKRKRSRHSFESELFRHHGGTKWSERKNLL